jgi:hypothetical protein
MFANIKGKIINDLPMSFITCIAKYILYVHAMKSYTDITHDNYRENHFKISVSGKEKLAYNADSKFNKIYTFCMYMDKQ